MRTAARVAFFLSGIAGLTFEIVWTRYLGLAMGATTLAVATVTAAYMGGLALGSHLGGRWADRIARPLVVYGGVEVCVAAMGLLVPILAVNVPSVDAMLPDASGGVRALVRFAVATGILVIPTTAMGMTLPVLARAVTRQTSEVGREVGLLYSLNIAGAVVGAACSGFWWIPALGHTRTNGIAVGLDLCLGLGAAAAGAVLAKVPVASAEERAGQSVLGGVQGRSLVVLLAVTGAAAMALQVLWTRAIATALGPSTYAFSAIVCAYLTGLALGGAVASRFADRVQQRVVLAVVLIATALFAFAGIAIVDDLPLLLRPVVLDETLTPEGLMRSQFFLAALCLLPATTAMGAIFPVTLAAVIGGESHLGAAVGRAYAINTIGSIAGSFAGVFILLPAFGIEWGMRVALLLYLLVAAVLIASLRAPEERRPRAVLAVALLVTALITTTWPSWDVARWTLGLFRLSMAREYFAEDEVPEPAKVVFHADGMASTVTVEEDEGVRWIKVDAKIDGSSEGDMPTQILSGLLGELTRPGIESAVVVGCGSCVTAGSILLTDVKRVTLVELEKEVVRAAHLFTKVNRGPWDDPRLTIVEDDGRNFLRRGARNPDGTYIERFDAIISEPSNPWMTGAASLFTTQYFDVAKRRLNPGGVFVQWLQIYEIAPERVGSVLKTFQSAFPNVLVFSAHRDSNDLLLVGSQEPLKLEWSRLEQTFTRLEKELKSADLHAPEELLALLLFTGDQVAALDSELNTDDNALVEFGAPKDLVTYAEDDPKIDIIGASAGKRWELVQRFIQVPDADWPDRLSRLAEGYLRQGMMRDIVGVARAVREKYPETPAYVRTMEIAEVAALLAEVDDEVVLDVETTVNDAQYAEVARLMLEGEDEAALEKMEGVTGLTRKSPAHALLHGYLLYAVGRYGEARRALTKAAENASNIQDQKDAITYYLAKEAYEVGEYTRAAEEMRRYRTSKRLSASAQED